MNELILMSESLGSLQGLLKRKTIFLDDIQQRFKTDLENYIVGETLSMREGRLIIGNNLYKKWLSKIKTKGFDYEIDFKQ